MTDVILQSRESFEALLDDVECNIGEWEFEFIIRERNGDYSLQIQFDATDNVGFEIINGMRAEVTGLQRQYCRLWPLQNTMCDTEIIRTVWKAVEAAVKHEVEEKFRFQGEMVFCPHTNIHDLVKMRRQENIDDSRIPIETLEEVQVELVPAIAYGYFVAVNYFDLDKREDMQAFCESEVVVMNDMDGTHYGPLKYELDSGGWRDRVLHPERGIEFARECDAREFIEQFGVGEFKLRSLR